MDFSIAIPTYNRLGDLKKCLSSILKQTVFPSEILIIDDGDLPEEFVQKTRSNFERRSINFVYYKKDHKKEPRGLSESKNIALKIASNKILFILDDDLILSDKFFEKIIKIWIGNKDQELIGVAGLIENNRKKSILERTYNKIFGLESKYNWDINPVGFQVWDEGIKKRKKGYYAHGGTCSYDKNLAQKLGFVTFSGGRTALEDVDFCLRAKNQSYHFIVEPEARVIHKQSRVSRENNFLMGFKEGYNRKIIFRDNCEKSLKNYLWFYWANIGWILRQFLAGHFKKGIGMIKGIFTKIK